MTRITISSVLITIWDDRQSKYPTLFGPDGHKLLFRDDGSSFNINEGLYRCAFQLTVPPSPGDTFVFATADYEVAIEVGADGTARTIDQATLVTRSSSKAPVSITGTPRPRITILIVTMNRCEFLKKTLWYIYETSTDEEREIFIWDNASTDETPTFLGTMIGWPGVRVFRSRTDLGISPPRKRMLPAVTTPYIFTLDDDVWLITRGWASACSRALDAEPSLHQLGIQQGHVHSTNNFGCCHSVLAKPFFWMPIFPPQDPGPPMDINAWRQNGSDDGTTLVDCGGEAVLVPINPSTPQTPRAGQLPFGVSGGAAAWRTSDILPLARNPERHPVCDLREVWGFPTMENRSSREGALFRYSAFHPCPGPLWHLGGGETYWAEKVRHSEAIYNRAAGEQARWLENAREATGWDQPLEDPDIALPKE